jgi:3-hydroxymyristoyl/3-hydroxydecanoyl-(acyl carrier protein) dehydratase
MTRETPLAFAADHPALPGHFPGMPIVPGVLLLDAAIHAHECEGRSVQGVASAKFLQPVGPGQALVLALEEATGARARYAIHRDGQPVATGALLLAPTPP